MWSRPPLAITEAWPLAPFTLAEGMTVERIRGRKLQRIREAHFKANPLCVMCLKAGHIAVAVELDHVIALTNGGTNDPENYQGLCLACHEIKTNADLGYTPKVETGADGWPVEAKPSANPHARWKRALGG